MRPGSWSSRRPASKAGIHVRAKVGVAAQLLNNVGSEKLEKYVTEVVDSLVIERVLVDHRSATHAPLEIPGWTLRRCDRAEPQSQPYSAYL